MWGLSVLSGVSPSLLTAIEKWAYVPTTNTQERIAAALGLRIEEIWDQEGGEPPVQTTNSLESGMNAQERT